jgi:hypothetical protein
VRQDLAPEANEKTVHERLGLALFISALLFGFFDCSLYQVLILGPLSGVEEQGRIRGGVLRLDARDGFDIARIRNDDAVLF